ncbi:serine/threonine-protein kinase [Actinomadura craniellae]|nr:serine/threonine-protein kinase [Actinomadura craniellae]
MEQKPRTGTWRVPGLPGFTELTELGTGTQGRVVLARQQHSGELVAIKYLAARYLADERFLARFRAEAGRLRRLRSPYVTRLHGYVEFSHGAAVVMEAVKGVTLRAVLDVHDRLDPVASLAVLKHSLLGLAAVHGVGVAHRDHRPADVLVPEYGPARLVDVALGAEPGEPAYPAPEGRPGPAADVYAATRVFMECATGDPDADPAELPRLVRSLIRAGLAEDPEDRPDSAAFAAELDEVATSTYGSGWEARGRERLATAAAALPATPFHTAPRRPPVPPPAPPAQEPAPPEPPAPEPPPSTRELVPVEEPGRQAEPGGLRGLFARPGAKVVLAVAGGAVLASAGGAGVYAVTHEHPRPPAFTLAVAPSPVATRVASPPFEVRASQVVTISGHVDPAAQRRINAALREPLDAEVARLRTLLNIDRRLRTPAGPECAQQNTIATAVKIGLTGPGLISARYRLALTTVGDCEGGLDWLLPVTVDVRTGRPLGLDDIFQPAVLTPAGLRSFVGRVRFPPEGECGIRPAEVTRADFEPNQDGRSRIGVMFALRHLEVSVSYASYRCRDQVVHLPYSEVRDLVRPEVLALALVRP